MSKRSYKTTPSRFNNGNEFILAEQNKMLLARVEELTKSQMEDKAYIARLEDGLLAFLAATIGNAPHHEWVKASNLLRGHTNE